MTARSLRPSRRWYGVNFQETVMIPLKMDSTEIDKLFLLQRMFGESPYLCIDKDGTEMYQPAPNNPTKGLMLFDPHDKKAYCIYNKNLGPKMTALGGTQLVAILDTYPVLSLLIRALLPRMGRNELMWMQTGPDIMMRRNSGPETPICRFFREHLLAEKQLLFVIISFL